MKTRILFMIIYIFLSNFIFPQTVICGTDSGLNPPFVSNAPTNSTLKNSYNGVNFCLNVYFHIIRNNEGLTTIPAYYPTMMLGELNEKYRAYNIQFKSLGTGYIDNSEFVNPGIYPGNVEEFFSTNSHSNAIDIYIVENADDFGSSNGVLAKELMIRKDYALTNVLIHEMGHCINLYHTHEMKFGKELVDESNSEFAGDLVSDTPANPNLGYFHNIIDVNCNATEPIIDEGITYYPDIENIMSYTTPDCMEHFTDGQVSRMIDALMYSDVLEDVMTCCDPETITISPTSEVCYSDTLILSLIDICFNTNTTWETSANIEVIEQDNFSIAIRAIDPGLSELGWVKATFDNSSQIIYEEIQVGGPNYYTENGEIESENIDIYYQRWTRLFLNNVYESSGWEWEVDYSNVRPSDAPMILIYSLVTGPIFARVRLYNRCGCGPWLTEYFEVIQDGPHKILKK